jgi:copper(I)-binding protein
MPRLMLLPAALVLAGLCAIPGYAQSPPVIVDHAWARATPPRAAAGALYFTLSSSAGDRLTGISTPAAQTADVHEMQMNGDVMRMRPVEGGLALPAGTPVVLAPGGYHVMLMGLKAPLKAGTDIPVHLTFQKAPPVDMLVPVQAIGASGPGH